MPAHLWLPASGSGPGLVLFQEIFGVSAYIRDRAADLAALGYAVVAPEGSWRREGAEVDEAREDFLEQAMGVAGRLDWGQAVRDGVAALGWLRGRPEVTGGAGVVGFCFGGGLAFAVAAACAEPDAGTATPDVLVSWYGSSLPQQLDDAPRVTTPSLHHFGLADTFIPQDQVRAVEAAVTPLGARFLTYEGAGHAFDNPHPMFHHEQASREAWEATEEFLAEVLPARG